jgi:hypothetical protein
MSIHTSRPAWRARLMTDWKRVRFVGYISVHGDIVYEQTDLNPKVSLGRCRVVVR